jgi:hypothetical protein
MAASSFNVWEKTGIKISPEKRDRNKYFIGIKVELNIYNFRMMIS